VNGFGGDSILGLTATAGTVINGLVPPTPGGIPRVSALAYKDGNNGTADTLSLLKVLGSTKCVGSVAAGNSGITIASNPGSSLPTPDAITSNDWLAITESDGVTRVYKVSSVTSLTSVTLSTNLVAGTVNGSPVYWFGVAGDTDQQTGRAQPSVKSNTNGTQFSLSESNGGLAAGHNPGEPLLFQSDNAQAVAGILQQLSYCYTFT
jgi:hypothetical protein